jgi:hypothetical protein
MQMLIGQLITESVITEVVIGISGHHLMLDVAREECAEVIMNWLKGIVV